MNPHAWALVIALGMQLGGISGAVTSAWAGFRDNVHGTWPMTLMAIFLAVLMLGFIPLGIWFHYNPCPAGCR